jgi:hypothetical protein
MATPREIPPVKFHGDTVSSEIDRLINSARIRIEQQRIHLSLLRGNINPERTRARRDLRDMIEGCERLRSIRRQLTD